ncbi:hypothetical protein ES705_40454 [subsurface metagenome]
MVDLKEEHKYEQLRKLGQELHLPAPEAFWTLEVFDKNGKLLRRHRQRSHSWTRNAYNLLLSQMAGKNLDDPSPNFGPGFLSWKQTSGGIIGSATGMSICISQDYEASGKGYRAPAGDTTHGIVVGSGTDAESFEDFKLQTLITEGSTAGKLNYILSAVPTKAYASLVFTITQFRYMNNNSGGNVSVNEVALTACGGTYGSQTKWITARDKLASTVTVPDTGQLKVTYTIQLTYPS